MKKIIYLLSLFVLNCFASAQIINHKENSTFNYTNQQKDIKKKLILKRKINTYKIYIGTQLKMYWDKIDKKSLNLPSNTQVKIQFSINRLGYLNKTLKIIKSSKNEAFNQLALNSLKSSFPVSKPPTSIHPPITLTAIYTINSTKSFKND